MEQIDRKDGYKAKEYALIDANIYRDIHTKLISNLEHASLLDSGEIFVKLKFKNEETPDCIIDSIIAKLNDVFLSCNAVRSCADDTSHMHRDFFAYPYFTLYYTYFVMIQIFNDCLIVDIISSKDRDCEMTYDEFESLLKFEKFYKENHKK